MVSFDCGADLLLYLYSKILILAQPCFVVRVAQPLNRLPSAASYSLKWKVHTLRLADWILHELPHIPNMSCRAATGLATYSTSASITCFDAAVRTGSAG